MESTTFKAAEVKLSYKTKIKPSERSKITTSKAADQVFRLFYSDEDIERIEIFSVMYLNRANRVLGVSIIGQGSLSSCIADAKIIFQGAILSNCSAIILCHNHPSGNLEPSKPDVDLTRKIKEGCRILEIDLLDHLIISPFDEFYSFRDNGII